MNKCIHFFDLDNTLWELDVKAWVILKDKPNKPLIKLNLIQYTDIKNGVFKSQENLIEYNGNNYWISDKMLNNIKKTNKNIELSDLGISFIEYTNPMYFKDLKFLVDNIRHLVGKKNIDFGIISARYDIENDHELLMVLKDKLKDFGIEINKFYYISNFLEIRNTERINNDKMKLILEHLVGYHIKDNYFEPIKQNFYEEIHFYDDELQNINVTNNIQQYFEEYLRNTDDDIFKKIYDRIKDKKPTLYTHLVSNNKLNKYKTTKIILTEPIKYAIKVDEKLITKFDKFNEGINHLLIGPTNKEIQLYKKEKWIELINGDLKGLIKLIPESPEDFFYNMIDGCDEMGNGFLGDDYGKNGIRLINVDTDRGWIYFSYKHIWSILKMLYHMNQNEIKSFISNQLANHKKYKNLNPYYFF